jgi:hypothetical protein
VSMCYTREESMLATGKRHPFWMSYTTGADEAGRVLAQKIELLADTGAFASYGLAVCGRAAVHGAGPYDSPQCAGLLPHGLHPQSVERSHARLRGAPGGPGPRGPDGRGGPTSWVLILLEVRLKNALRNGSRTRHRPVAQKSGVGLVQCLEKHPAPV